MNDRDLQVLEQYPFTVRGSFRVRGAFLLDTSEGRRLIQKRERDHEGGISPGKPSSVHAELYGTVRGGIRPDDRIGCGR